MERVVATNQAQVPHGHSAFQAGEQAFQAGEPKSNKAFTVKGVNLHRPTELQADSQGLHLVQS